MSGWTTRRRSRLRVLLAAVQLALLLLALVPGSASAQTAGDSCDGKLTGADQQAELSFSCNFNVRALEIFSNKDATISGDFNGEQCGNRASRDALLSLARGPVDGRDACA